MYLDTLIPYDFTQGFLKTTISQKISYNKF